MVAVLARTSWPIAAHFIFPPPPSTITEPWFFGDRFETAAISVYAAIALRALLLRLSFWPVCFAALATVTIGEAIYFAQWSPTIGMRIYRFQCFPIFLAVFYATHFAVVFRFLYRDAKLLFYAAVEPMPRNA